MKAKIIQFIFIVIGLILIAYPILSDFISSYNQTIVISDYQEKIKTMTEEEKSEQLNLAQKYNEELESETSIDVSLDENKEKQNLYESYLNVLNIGDTIAYISIPKIDVYLPIYRGISKNVLQSGVGHIENTSLPIGGKGTHCVLAGHTGLARKKIFDNLDKLEIGDIFYIYVLDEILTYEVDNIQVIEPDNTEAIKFDEEKDFVTLVTCTPYMVNSHRLLVRGSRVIDTQESDNLQNDVQSSNTLDDTENTNQTDVNDKKIDIQKLKEKRLRNVIMSFIILIIMIIIAVKYIFNNKKK